MALVTSPKRYLVDADVQFNPLNDESSYDGWRQIFNVTSLAVQYASETDSIIGRDLNNSQQTLDSLVTAGETTLSMTVNRVNGYGFALANRGTESLITSGSTAVTGETYYFTSDAFRIIKRDVTSASVVIRGYNITVDDTTGFSAGNVLTNNTTGLTIGVIVAVVDATHLTFFLTDYVPATSDVVTDDGGVTTATISAVTASNALAVKDTDFTEDEETSTGVMVVNRTSGGSLDLANLTKVVINYSYTQTTGSQIAMAAKSQIKGQMHITGINRSNNDAKIDALIREVTLTADGDINLIADDTIEYSFTGTCATPASASDLGIVNVS